MSFFLLLNIWSLVLESESGRKVSLAYKKDSLQPFEEDKNYGDIGPFIGYLRSHLVHENF